VGRSGPRRRPAAAWRAVPHVSRLVKTQCSCSSGFSSELRPWIGSSLKYDCSLVTRGSVRFYIRSFLKITTWTRSSALIGPEGTLLVFLFQAPFTKIDMHRSGIRPASDRHGRDAHHTRTRHPQLQLWYSQSPMVGHSCGAKWPGNRCAPIFHLRQSTGTAFFRFRRCGLQRVMGWGLGQWSSRSTEWMDEVVPTGVLLAALIAGK